MESGRGPRPDGAGAVWAVVGPAVELTLRRRRRLAGVAAVSILVALTGWLLVSAPRDVPTPAEQAATAVLWGQYKRPADPEIAAFGARGRSERGRQPQALAGDVPVAPPPAAFDGLPRPPAPPPTQLWTAPPGGAGDTGVWAVVVGVNDYPGSKSDLRSAVSDANDVNAALAGFGVPEGRRLVLRDRQATGNMILTAVDWLVAHAGPQSTAVLFYAGHVRKLSADREVLVGSDGAVVSDVELSRHLLGLKASQTWIALAACYSGGFQELRAPGRILTAATDGSHLAYENLDFGRSYLVQYMVRKAMLGGAAPESVQDAFLYAKKALEKDYPTRVPVLYDDAVGVVDLRSPDLRAAAEAQKDEARRKGTARG